MQKKIMLVVDETIYSALKDAAKIDCRSMNSFINVAIRRALPSPQDNKAYAH